MFVTEFSFEILLLKNELLYFIINNSNISSTYICKNIKISMENVNSRNECDKRHI